MVRIDDYPKRKDGSPYYWSVLLRMNEDVVYNFYRKQLDEFGYIHSFNNPMRRIWVPADEEGEKKLQSLIDQGLFESVYRSQGLYYSRRTHTKHGISFFSHLWVDIDIQKTMYADEWQEMNDNEKVIFIFGHCLDQAIPMPSSIYFSGRGCYLTWDLNHKLFNFPTKINGRGHAKRRVGEFVKLLNVKLVKKLRFLGADMMSTDCARVLRVPGSINPKSDETVRLLHSSNITYSTKELAKNLLSYTHEECLIYLEKKREEYKKQGRIWKEIQKNRQKKKTKEINSSLIKEKKGEPKFSNAKHTANVINDLRTLASIRWKNGIVAKGYRDIFGHISVSMVASISKPDRLLRETEQLIRDFMPSDYLAKDFEKHNSTSVRKLRGGDRYSYSIAKMIDLLNITESEMDCLNTLLSPDKKRERNNRRDREKTRQKNIESNKPMSISKAQPWLKEGMGRSKWYELKKEREEKEAKEALIKQAIEKKKESNSFAEVYKGDINNIQIDDEKDCILSEKCDKVPINIKKSLNTS